MAEGGWFFEWVENDARERKRPGIMTDCIDDSNWVCSFAPVNTRLHDERVYAFGEIVARHMCLLPMDGLSVGHGLTHTDKLGCRMSKWWMLMLYCLLLLDSKGRHALLLACNT